MDYGIRISSGGYLSPSHVRRRLLARACPRFRLRIVLTNGQTSTDSDMAALKGFNQAGGLRLRVGIGRWRAHEGPGYQLVTNPRLVTLKGRSQQREAVLIKGRPAKGDCADVKDRIFYNQRL